MHRAKHLAVGETHARELAARHQLVHGHWRHRKLTKHDLTATDICNSSRTGLYYLSLGLPSGRTTRTILPCGAALFGVPNTVWSARYSNPAVRFSSRSPQKVRNWTTWDCMVGYPAPSVSGLTNHPLSKFHMARCLRRRPGTDLCSRCPCEIMGGRKDAT